jgi:hypothetical protein
MSEQPGTTPGAWLDRVLDLAVGHGATDVYLETRANGPRQVALARARIDQCFVDLATTDVESMAQIDSALHQRIQIRQGPIGWFLFTVNGRSYRCRTFSTTSDHALRIYAQRGSDGAPQLNNLDAHDSAEKAQP